MLRILNNFLWKHFHFCVRIEKNVKYYKADEHNMVYAYNCFGYGQRCWSKNGKFISLNDGSELKGIVRFTNLH